MRPNWKWLLWGAAWLVASAILLASIPVIFGSPRPIVRVTWRDLGPGDRAELERRFHLADPITLSDDTWGYQPIDTSREVLRALVQHPAVARVDGIDARAATIARSLPLSPRRGGWIEAAPRWVSRAVRLLAYILALGALDPGHCGNRLADGCDPVAVPASAGFAAIGSCQRDSGIAGTDPSPGILRGIPAVSPATAGLFRIVFGVSVMGYLATERLISPALQSYEVNAATGVYGSVVRWLSAHPAVPQSLDQWLLVSGLFFIAGLLDTNQLCVLRGWISPLVRHPDAHDVRARDRATRAGDGRFTDRSLGRCLEY